jgi:hypothetical protein
MVSVRTGEEGAQNRGCGAAAFGLVVLGILGDALERIDGGVGSFGEADGGVVGCGVFGGCDVGADFGGCVEIEETGEVVVGCFGHVGE